MGEDLPTALVRENECDLRRKPAAPGLRFFLPLGEPRTDRIKIASPREFARRRASPCNSVIASSCPARAAAPRARARVQAGLPSSVEAGLFFSPIRSDGWPVQQTPPSSFETAARKRGFLGMTITIVLLDRLLFVPVAGINRGAPRSFCCSSPGRQADVPS